MRIEKGHLYTFLLVLGILLLGTAQATAQTCRGITATIVGTGGADRIDGTSGRDVIQAKAGSDFVDGKAGADTICGKTGSDDVWGGSGNDVVDGGGGADNVLGLSGCDALYGGTGNDYLTAVGPALDGSCEFVNGEAGYDTCVGAPYTPYVNCECFAPTNLC